MNKDNKTEHMLIRSLESVRPIITADLRRPVGVISIASLAIALSVGIYLGVQYGEKGMCDCRTVCP